MMIDPNPRQLKYGNDARQALIKGANAVAKAVAVTLGPRGRHVVIDKSPRSGIIVTKDGVTVAKEVNPVDITENTGAQLFKKAAIHSVNYAGDGTTFPLKKNKYYKNYSIFFTNIINNNNIKFIYLIEFEGISEALVTDYIDNSCFIRRKKNHLIIFEVLKKCSYRN